MDTSNDLYQFTIDLPPVPAARPKMGRYGAYYPKKYTTFQREADKLVRKIFQRRKPLLGPLIIVVILWCSKPKTTQRDLPRGDVDNYEKAVYDCLNEYAWNDDDQISDAQISKRFSVGKPFIQVCYRKQTSLSMEGRDFTGKHLLGVNP